MKHSYPIIFLILLLNCSPNKELNMGTYFGHVNQAELAICNQDFEKALHEFELAFDATVKPFGKDLFNMALASQLCNKLNNRDAYLQEIINNTEELDYVKSVFVGVYMTQEEWQRLLLRREIKYNPQLRAEFKEIHRRDQLFRPMYDTHDDTINANRKLNLKRILELTDSSGFPSHLELGYDQYFRTQAHYIVLHHTAQRRSYDKTVIDLEPILKLAVEQGRFDPELAIFYLNFQNDPEKGSFEVYSSWQHQHHLLPDSLNKKVWFRQLNEEQILKANAKRKEWFANSISDIKTKVNFLNDNDLPFIFSSVRKSIGILPYDLNKNAALEQYHLMSSFRLRN